MRSWGGHISGSVVLTSCSSREQGTKACILRLKECQSSRANHSAGNWEQTSESIFHLRKWNSESSKPHWITNELIIHLNLIMPRGTTAAQTLETGTVYTGDGQSSTRLAPTSWLAKRQLRLITNRFPNLWWEENVKSYVKL